MTTTRTSALLATLMFALSWAPISVADQADSSDEQAIEHIRLLEKMLRDAGVEPPVRPNTLAQQVEEKDKPIIPPSFASVVFETEVAAINERTDKAAAAIGHIRRWLTKDDVKRRVASQDIIDTLTAWADNEMSKINTSADEVGGHMIADDAISLLEQDPLAKPFKQHMKSLKRNRTQWHDIVSMAAYRRAIAQAEDVGLTGDWALIDFQNINVRLDIKNISAKLTLITNNWPTSDAAKSAQANLDNWQAKQEQAIADLPAWRYTWQLDLINIGTETSTTIVTKPDGTVIIDEDQRQVYDPEKVLLYGTFQNTSDKPYRYTFVAGVTSGGFFKTPFNQLKQNQLIGFELIQTPLLQPGELHNWKAFVAVDSIRNLNRGGVTLVEIRERNAGR
ncbi:MAG: hypothetical protein AB8C95_08990 [Phycisphaeraceae bacterium]